MKTQGLNQHHVCELLCDQKTAGLRIVKFLPQSLQRPAHRRLLRFFPDMNDRRQLRQKDIGTLTSEDEVPADKEAISPAIARGDHAIQGERKDRLSIDRRQSQITRKAGSKPTR